MRKGDIVGIFLPNCTEYPTVFLGILSVGATVTTMNPAYTEAEVEHQASHSQAKLLVTTASLAKLLLSAAPGVPLIVIPDVPAEADLAGNARVTLWEKFIANDGQFAA